jgi:hypothetical protein
MRSEFWQNVVAQAGQNGAGEQLPFFSLAPMEAVTDVAFRHVVSIAAYKDFVDTEGFISKPANSALVANMPDGALVQALELSYRKAIGLAQAKKMGEKARPEQADPAPILTERVIPKYEPPTKASTPADALSIVMSESGRVDALVGGSYLGITRSVRMGAGSACSGRAFSPIFLACAKPIALR